MKTALILLSCLIGVAQAERVNAHHVFEQTALHYLDEVCGDAWCTSGDFDLRFTKLDCSPWDASPFACQLNFQKGLYNGDQFLGWGEELGCAMKQLPSVRPFPEDAADLHWVTSIARWYAENHLVERFDWCLEHQ